MNRARCRPIGAQLVCLRHAPDSGRGAIETREMPEALGCRALGSLAFSVIAVGRSGAGRCCSRSARGGLSGAKKSQADCKVGLPLPAGLDASDHPARAPPSSPKGRAKIAERTRSLDSRTKSSRLEIKLDGTMRPSWPSSSANFIELRRKRRVANLGRQCGR
jgi:hypothetical protein